MDGSVAEEWSGGIGAVAEERLRVAVRPSSSSGGAGHSGSGASQSRNGKWLRRLQQ